MPDIKTSLRNTRGQSRECWMIRSRIIFIWHKAGFLVIFVVVIDGFVTWICLYFIWLLVDGAMHETDDAYSIRSTWSCYSLPTTGRGWMERRLPVWREEYRSFKKPFVFFCFGYFPGYFRQFSDTRRWTPKEWDLWMCRWAKFVSSSWFLTQCNLPAILRCFTQ